MSRGKYQPRNQSSRRVLERCRTRHTIEIIDVDKEKIDLVIVDAEETSHLGSRGSGTRRRNSCPSVISIDDEDGSIDGGIRKVHSDAARKEFCPASSNCPMSEESKSDECPMITRKEIPPFRSMQYMKKCHDVGPSVNQFGLSESSESCSYESDSSEFDPSESINSDSDSSDCEIMEASSGNIREQWERAALKKKMSDRVRFGSEDQSSASGSSADAGLFSEEATYCKSDIENCINKVCSNYSEEIPAETYPKNSSYENENVSFNVPADNGLHGSFWKKNVDTTDLDTDSTTNIGHKKPEHTAETCSHRAQSTYETLSDNLRFGFRDPKTVFCTSKCDLNMQHDPKIKDDDVRAHHKDEQVPVATTSGATGLHGESSIWGKVGPCPGQSSPLNPQSSPDNSIQDKKKHLPGEPPLSMQPQCDSIASPETAHLQRKDKSSSDESSLCNYQCPDSSSLNVDCETTHDEPPICNTNGGSGATERSIASDTGPHDIPQVHTGLICERERHKESDEYRRAVEEEWAARQLQLQIQAEEIQKMKRKRKAETLRILDMERRQKQRLEEIRESQKKDEETINLKEQLRAEVRKELEKIELRYRDMASLLRGLGIHVGGGPYPMPREVNAAYKQALLRFHPDRASRSDIRQQVRAEETFKLISRVKEKLLPVM